MAIAITRKFTDSLQGLPLSLYLKEYNRVKRVKSYTELIIIVKGKAMKEAVDAGLTGLKGFYEVIDTKQKAFLLIVIWALCGMTYLGQQFGNVETIERLIMTYTKSRVEVIKSRELKLETKAGETAQNAKTNQG